MAGGDLLYIVAFIILPTAVLVSCIWALILLRNGTLLPVRPASSRGHDISQAATPDDEATDDPVELVEETGEHLVVTPDPTVVIPTVAVPVAAAPASDPMLLDETAPEPDLGEQVADAGSSATPPVDEPPPAERTQELDVMPVDTSDVAGECVDQSATDVDEAALVESAAVPDEPDVASEAEDAASVLIVPLDEPARIPPAERPATTPTASGDRSPSIPTSADADNDRQSPQPTDTAGQRRPSRRIAQMRSTDDSAPRPRPRAGQRRGTRRADGE